MKTGNHKNILKFGWVAIAVVTIGALAGIFRVLAFTGPTLGGGVGSGALGTDAAGNVSVGTSTTQSNTKFFVLGSTTNSSAYGMQIWNSANTALLTVRNDGYVGIGTASPGALFDVNGSSFFGGTSAGSIGTVQITSGGASPINNRLVFGTDGSGWKFAISKNQTGVVSDLLTIQDNGYVGVGTTTPSQQLTVQGNIYATGNITCGGTCGGGSSQWTTTSTGIYYTGGTVSAPQFSGGGANLTGINNAIYATDANYVYNDGAQGGGAGYTNPSSMYVYSAAIATNANYATTAGSAPANGGNAATVGGKSVGTPIYTCSNSGLLYLSENLSAGCSGPVGRMVGP